MTELLVSQFATLFVVVDPIGLAVIFTGLTHGATPRQRRHMAARASALSTFMLLLFFFYGQGFLDLLGITQPAFHIAGGALLFLLAIDMVFARQSGLRSTTSREREEAESKQDISVFPLAFPLIAGPGALTTVVLMTGNNAGVALTGAMAGVILVVMLITMAALLTASHIGHLLGETGANVISRLLGLVLAALAVQYMIDGAGAVVGQLAFANP